MEIPESITPDLNSLWVYEKHPWAEMGHDNCGGAGCPWNEQMHTAIQLVADAERELRACRNNSQQGTQWCCGGEDGCEPFCVYRKLREYLGMTDGR